VVESMAGGSQCRLMRGRWPFAEFQSNRVPARSSDTPFQQVSSPLSRTAERSGQVPEIELPPNGRVGNYAGQHRRNDKRVPGEGVVERSLAARITSAVDSTLWACAR